MFKTVSGERNDVNMNIVENWKKRLPTVCKDYDEKDIFNMDETALFFKQGKSTTFYVAGADLTCGKLVNSSIVCVNDGGGV